jgi:mRNA interferase HigB
MHIISRKALKRFWEQHPDSQAPLIRWYKIIEKSGFSSFPDLRQAFPSADKVGDLIVFNIGVDILPTLKDSVGEVKQSLKLLGFTGCFCNKYRLIASIHFNRNKVYIRHVLTHPEYDKGAWRQ